jgi:hypothetical protein
LYPARRVAGGDAKKRGWTIQHRPTSNPSKALPDSPGRAARKPAGKKLSVLAGLNASASGRFMAGVAQRNKIPGPASLLETRKTRFQQKLDIRKTIDLPPNFAYKLIVIYLD